MLASCNMHVYATSRSAFATSRQNTCNIYLEQMKHLKHTLETYVYNHYNMCNVAIYFCNIQTKHLQHSSGHRNIWNIHLKHTCITITTCAASRSTVATSIYNTCNIPLKYLKHLKHTIATCVFSVTSAHCWDEWSLVDAELDAAE